MRLMKDDAVAVLVDLQEKMVPPVQQPEELLKNCVTLMKGLQALEVPILPLRQYPKGLGQLVPPIVEALGPHTPFDKVSFSGYGAQGFPQALEQLGRRTVLLFGIETHICVLQTALDLLDQGYRVAIVCDCVSSRRTRDHEIALRRAEQNGAQLVTMEGLLFELVERAGSPTFKTISSLVK